MLCRESELLTDVHTLYAIAYNNRPATPESDALVTMSDVELSALREKPVHDLVTASHSLKRCLTHLDDKKVTELRHQDASIAKVVSLVMRDAIQGALSRFHYRMMGVPFTGWVELGQLMATGMLAHAMEEQSHSLVPFFNQHAQMQWGELGVTDCMENDMALLCQVVQEQMALLSLEDQPEPNIGLHQCLERHGRLFSKYELEGGEHIYIITDFETPGSQRTTTAMYTDDY